MHTAISSPPAPAARPAASPVAFPYQPQADADQHPQREDAPPLVHGNNSSYWDGSNPLLTKGCKLFHWFVGTEITTAIVG